MLNKKALCSICFMLILSYFQLQAQGPTADDIKYTYDLSLLENYIDQCRKGLPDLKAKVALLKNSPDQEALTQAENQLKQKYQCLSTAITRLNTLKKLFGIKTDSGQLVATINPPPKKGKEPQPPHLTREQLVHFNEIFDHADESQEEFQKLLDDVKKIIAEAK